MPIFGRGRRKENEGSSQEGINSGRFLKLVGEKYPGYEDGVRTVLFGTKPYDSFIQAGVSVRRFGNNIEAEIEIEGQSLKFNWRRTPQI